MLSLILVLPILLSLCTARRGQSPNYGQPAPRVVSSSTPPAPAGPLATPTTLGTTQAETTTTTGGIHSGDITHYEVGLGSCRYVDSLLFYPLLTGRFSKQFLKADNFL